MRQQAKNKLADSIARHAKHEVHAAMSKFKTNLNSMKTAVGDAIPAVIACYEGKHYVCVKHSLVCDGVHVPYEYLPKYVQGTFRFSEEDKHLLRMCFQSAWEWWPLMWGTYFAKRPLSVHLTQNEQKTDILQTALQIKLVQASMSKSTQTALHSV